MVFALLAGLMVLMPLGCSSQPDTNHQAAKTPVEKAVAASKDESANKESTPLKKSDTSLAVSSNTESDFVIQVNGVTLSQAELNKELDRKMSLLRNQLPADRIEQAKAQLKAQAVNDFVVRTLLAGEVTRVKVEATEQEVNEALDHLQEGLPKGMTIDDLLKKNAIPKDEFLKEITLGVQINKLILTQPLAGAKPTEKEIRQYYDANKGKFQEPEMVHARHILIAKKPGDDKNVQEKKKAKAELLRKELVAGADFVDLAAKNSDDSSKNNGGDLGTFPRGQMVKPFEDAAFSQKVNEIGPVVETQYGYHIIQVLAHHKSKTIQFDDTVKKEIGILLQQQKRQEAFNQLLKRLSTEAKIIYPGKETEAEN